MSKAAVNCGNCRALTLIPCRLEGIGDFPPGHQHPMAKTGIGADVWKLVAEKLSVDCAVHGGEGTTDCVLMPGPGAKPDLLPGPSRGVG